MNVNMFRQEPTLTLGIQRNSKREDLHGLRVQTYASWTIEASQIDWWSHGAYKLVLVLCACCLHVAEGSNSAKKNNGMTERPVWNITRHSVN